MRSDGVENTVQWETGKRRRGRLKRRWLDNIRNDVSDIGLLGEEVQYQTKRRCLIVIRNITEVSSLVRG